ASWRCTVSRFTLDRNTQMIVRRRIRQAVLTQLTHTTRQMYGDAYILAGLESRSRSTICRYQLERLDLLTFHRDVSDLHVEQLTWFDTCLTIQTRFFINQCFCQ